MCWVCPTAGHLLAKKLIHEFLSLYKPGWVGFLLLAAALLSLRSIYLISWLLSHQMITGYSFQGVTRSFLKKQEQTDLGCELSLAVAGTMLLTKRFLLWVGGGLRDASPASQGPTLHPSHCLIWPPATLSFPCHWAGSDKALVEEITDRCSGTNQRPRGRKAVRFSLKRQPSFSAGRVITGLPFHSASYLKVKQWWAACARLKGWRGEKRTEGLNLF